MIRAAEHLAPSVGLASACRALGVARASVYRHRKPPRPRPAESRGASPRALSPEERVRVLDILHEDRFVDLAPAAVYATLLAEGRYVCSIRTWPATADLAYRTTTPIPKANSKHSNTRRHTPGASPVRRKRVPTSRSSFPGTIQNTVTAAWGCSRPIPCTTGRHNSSKPQDNTCSARRITTTLNDL